MIDDVQCHVIVVECHVIIVECHVTWCVGQEGAFGDLG